MKETYRVDGMSCGGCVNAVTKAIRNRAPNANVSVDLEAKTVTVDGMPGAETVRQAVEEAGFDFVGKA